MSSRQLFPNLKLFKKEVTERFLTVTRGLYEHHPIYSYLEDESESGLLIYPSYADPEYDGKKPSFVAKTGSYNYHLQDTLFNNMSNEVKNSYGSIAGFEYSQIITVPITVLIHAYAEEESSDLADELTNLVVFACRNTYSREGLIVRGGQVSETDIFNNEQKVFQTTINFTFDVPWVTSSVDTSPPAGDVILTPDWEDPIEFDTYRSPGVTVVKDERGT